MALTSRHKEILNGLIDYIPALRKGQISTADGGDIQLGDSLDAAASVQSTEIDLASGKVMIGQSTGKAAEKTLSGDASVATTTGVVTVANSAVIGKVLTGYVSGAGAVAATDTILQGFNKLNGNAAALATTVSGKADKPAGIVALGVTSNLVGVDGTGSNAAPLAGTESRLDAIEAKLDALIAALNA